MSYRVYMYTNTQNGKVYIGQTKHTLNERAGANGVNYKESRRFFNAINKYGWDVFLPTVLADDLNESEVDWYEQAYVSLFDSVNPSKGYNIQSGGNNHTVTNETRCLISENAKIRYMDPTKNPMFGKSHSAITLRKMSEAKAGSLNPMFGTTWTDTQRAKCGTKGKKLNLSDDRRAELRAQGLRLGKQRAKRVMCVEDNLIFDSIGEASTYYGVSLSTLSGHLNGRQRVCKGKHFQYVISSVTTIPEGSTPEIGTGGSGGADSPSA